MTKIKCIGGLHEPKTVLVYKKKYFIYTLQPNTVIIKHLSMRISNTPPHHTLTIKYSRGEIIPHHSQLEGAVERAHASAILDLAHVAMADKKRVNPVSFG